MAREVEKAENQRNAIMAQANKDVSEIEKGFSRDYLARVDALSEIEKNKPHVTTVERFILSFFIFVEILPLTLKITTPIGEYEYLRDTLLLDAKLNQDMEREIAKTLFSDPNNTALRKMNFGYDIERNEFLGITRTTLEFMKQAEENVKIRDKQIEEINGSIKKQKIRRQNKTVCSI